MAAGGPLRVRNVIEEEQGEPFDFNDLCARLETAKRHREEKEAAALQRKQARATARENNGPDPREAQYTRRSQTSPVIGTTNWNESWSQISGRPISPHSPRSFDPYLRCTTLDTSIAQHDFGNPDQMLSPESMGVDERNTILLSRQISNGGEQDPTSPHDGKVRVKRSSWTILKKSPADDQSVASEKPANGAQRRSWTSPLFKTKPTSPIPKVPEHESSMSFVNEYTVSYDTWDTGEYTQRHNSQIEQASPTTTERPPSPRRSSSNDTRSFLNLPLILKKDRKDKTRTSVEEVVPEEDEHEHDQKPEEGDFDMAAIPRSRPHTRSATAPENLICEAAVRLQKEERKKKRRTFGAVLQTILIPNHSMSHHTVHI